jgi:hypothetical protein
MNRNTSADPDTLKGRPRLRSNLRDGAIGYGDNPADR